MMLSAGENVLHVAEQMGHADWSMLSLVYGRWLPSGAANQAGELVAKANVRNWGRLVALLEERSGVEPKLDDYEQDDESDNSELKEAVEMGVHP